MADQVQSDWYETNPDALAFIKNKPDIVSGGVQDVQVDGASVVDQQGVAQISIPVNDVEVDGVSVVNAQGVAEIPSTGNVDDVQVNGTSVVSNKIAAITSYKEITRAEYDALPATKNSDGILYAIKDEAGAKGDRYLPEIYSTEEREVGVWTDGKPLYQKTIHVASLPSTAFSQTQYAHSISNIDTIVDYDGIMRWSTGQVTKTVRFAMYSSTVQNEFGSDLAMEVDKTNILITAGTDRSAMNADVTIKYTKTTDTPGSGHYPIIDGGSARFYHFSGEVWNSNAGSVKGRGSIDITLTGGIARVDFDIKITASGTDGNEFLQGINSYLLQTAESRLPYITPMLGGWWKSSSDNPSTDYGSVFEVDREFWKPARYYDASDINAHGAWAENQFASGQRIFGVCFGTYS